MIRFNQVTNIFRSGHDCTSTVFCKKTSFFQSSSRYHNLGPSENACRHNAYSNPVPLLLAAPLEVHEMTWKCFDFLALGFPKAMLKYLHRTNSLNSCSQSSNSCERSLCTSSDSPFIFFMVSVDSCNGFPSSSSLVLPLLFGTGFSVYLLTSNTESCGDDEVCVGVVEELVDKPGTTNGT